MAATRQTSAHACARISNNLLLMSRARAARCIVACRARVVRSAVYRASRATVNDSNHPQRRAETELTHDLSLRVAKFAAHAIAASQSWRDADRETTEIFDGTRPRAPATS